MTNSRSVQSQGSKNIVADALSRQDKKNKNIEQALDIFSKSFALDNEDILYPTSFKTIMRFQQKDKSLIEIAKECLRTIPWKTVMQHA